MTGRFARRPHPVRATLTEAGGEGATTGRLYGRRIANASAYKALATLRSPPAAWS